MAALKTKGFDTPTNFSKDRRGAARAALVLLCCVTALTAPSRQVVLTTRAQLERQHAPTMNSAALERQSSAPACSPTQAPAT
jgi:hypothetical protein